MPTDRRRLRVLLGKLPSRFQWTLHNLVAHPLSEIVFQLGMETFSNTIHDITVPEHKPGTGRG
jgi:ethanolamine utilization microcompartment shell protein EutS